MDIHGGLLIAQTGMSVSKCVIESVCVERNVEEYGDQTLIHRVFFPHVSHTDPLAMLLDAITTTPNLPHPCINS